MIRPYVLLKIFILQTYRSYFVDDEASDSEASDHSDSEETIDLRLRQKHESVPLRKRGHRNIYETVVDRLEAEAQQALAQREHRQVFSPRRRKAVSPPGIAPTPVDSPSPVDSAPPAFEELTVDTCTGPATIRLPLVPNEDELSRETRIFTLEAEVQRTRERQEIARMAGQIRTANPPASPYLANTATSAPSSPAALPFSEHAPPPSLSSPAAASPRPDSDPELDESIMTDPFGLAAVQRPREPLLFPPLSVSTLETLSLFQNYHSSALDELDGYDSNEDFGGSNSDEVPTSKEANILM